MEAPHVSTLGEREYQETRTTVLTDHSGSNGKDGLGIVGGHKG